MLLAVGLFAQPAWDVNPSEYEMSANITSALQFNFESTSDGNIIGAFDGDECVGVAEPIFALDSWLYFLTVYSNTTGNEIIFKAYFSETGEILDIEEVIEFQPNAVYGSPIGPFVFNVVSEFDFPPIVNDIPNQTIEIGNSFDMIDLSNYLETQDDDLIIWSVSDNTNLQVDMNETTATVSPINPDWIGSETVAFTATDDTENGLSDSDEIVFTILPMDNPPELLSIPNQVIGVYGQFESINLNNYLTELDGDEIEFGSRIEIPVTPESNPNWSVNPADFEMSMTVTAIVESQGEIAENSNHVFSAFSNGECRGVTTAINALDSWIYFLTMYSNQNGETIEFQFYDSEYAQILPTNMSFTFTANASHGTPEYPILMQAAHYFVTINDNAEVTIEIVDDEWIGSEEITFIVQDQNTLNDYSSETTASFTIEQDYAPQVGGIPNQTIEQGGEFELINLDEYLLELDGESVVWSASGNTNLSVDLTDDIATIISSNYDFIGEETILFTATDDTENGFSGSQSVVFTILAFDNPPEIQSIPNQEITLGEEFMPINLTDYLIELDGDEVIWNYALIQTNYPESNPNWEVNPADFELLMTVTAVIQSNGEIATQANHVLSAFSNDAICGVESNPIEFNGQWLYFLTVYSNINNEEISFKFYDSEFEETFPCKEAIIFQSNQSVGDPMNPQLLQAGHFLINFSNPNYGTIEQVNPSWIGQQDIQISVQDQNTLHEYLDTTTITITVNVLLGDPTIDGIINIQDVILTVNFALGMQTPTDDQQIAADINEDGNINIQDVILVVNAALGI